MKTGGFILLLVSMFFASQPVLSQVQVLKKWSQEEGSPNPTAYFVYRDSDEENLANLAKAIGKVWTLSKIEE